MHKLFKFVFCALLMPIFICTLSSVVCAKKSGEHGNPSKENMMNMAEKGHKNFNSMKKNSKFSDSESKRFTDKDKTIIKDYFAKHQFNTTGLPPGIAMNLARGKPLPPGIKKVFLPNELSDLLGANPNYEYLAAGKDVLLVDRSSQIVADILSNVLH